METIATLIISILLFVVGIEFIKESIVRLIDFFNNSITSFEEPSWFIIALVFATGLLKIVNSEISRHMGKMIQSDTLHADAWHHISDFFSTVVVVLALAGSKFGYYWLDGAGGLIVSLILIYAGYSLAKDAINTLIGKAPPEDFVKKINNTATSVKGVLGVHDIIVHNYGITNLISLHVELDDKLDAQTIHDICELVENNISAELKVKTVVVHPDPITIDHPLYDLISQALSDLVQNMDEVHSFHDLRIVKSLYNDNVIFDFVVEHNIDEKVYSKIYKITVSKLEAIFPNMNFNIQFVKSFVPNIFK